MSMPTLLDIAVQNAADPAVGLIDEAIQATPEVMDGAARTIKGLQYKTLVCLEDPTVSFRNANEGTAPAKARYENRLIECYIFNPRWVCDKAVADANEDGPEAYIALEGLRMTRASMKHLASQFYYGSANDEKGFPGLIAAYDSTNMVVDAGGTAAKTGSSVWAVKWGPLDVQWVYGLNGQLALDDVSEIQASDDDGNEYTAYLQELLARPGLQVASKYSVARIKKLTEDEGKGLTDDLIAELLSKFPVGVVPDVLYMNRRSLRQLRESRTATNATGAPAPFPSDAFGVPIKVTDSIASTESLTL